VANVLCGTIRFEALYRLSNGSDGFDSGMGRYTMAEIKDKSLSAVHLIQNFPRFINGRFRFS